MKVGTDSVLLGAWARLQNSRHILDIGTGCGLLALMAAQRSEAQIIAIDVDQPAIETAAQNFSLSPWSSRLTALQTSLQEYSLKNTLHSYDHIISNPPYFINSLKAPEIQRSNARHTDLLPFAILAELSAGLLTDKGLLSLILPVNESEIYTQLAKVHHLFPSRQLNVIPRAGRTANRILMEFSKSEITETGIEELVIRDSSGNYTDAYQQLTRDFYLNF